MTQGITSNERTGCVRVASGNNIFHSCIQCRARCVGVRFGRMPAPNPNPKLTALKSPDVFGLPNDTTVIANHRLNICCAAGLFVVS